MQNKKEVYFVTNTKMSKGTAESIRYYKELEKRTRDLDFEQIELAVMLPYTALNRIKESESGGQLLLGAQNVCGRTELTYTGEISVSMLKELGVDCVLAGHSERRYKLGESDPDIAQKAAAAAAGDMIVFLSISETEKEKKQNISDESLRIQLKRGLRQIPAKRLGQIRILYEPLWAIGMPGDVVDPQYVEKRHEAIRGCLKELYGEASAYAVPLIYGGSIDSENAIPLIDQPQIDGLGIGRSAWQEEKFDQIIRRVLAHLKNKESEDKNYAENFK